MPPSEQREIVRNLEEINHQLLRQSSLLRMFGAGIIYGVGFFIGSAIIATIALGIFAPWFADIPWIRTAFQTGASLLH